MKYLKVDSSKGYVEAQGSVVDIAEMVLAVIGAIYDNYAANGFPAQAEFFKQAIYLATTDPDCPVFQCSGPNGDSVLLDISEIERMRNHDK